MVSLLQNDNDGDDGPRSFVLSRPVTVKTLAEALKKHPFEIRAEFMELNLFVAMCHELDEDQLSAYGKEHGCRFQVVD